VIDGLSCRVYSVGPDLVDDGGESDELLHGKQRDVVYTFPLRLFGPKPPVPSVPPMTVSPTSPGGVPSIK
jgi:hypothetical protein